MVLELNEPTVARKGKQFGFLLQKLLDVKHNVFSVYSLLYNLYNFNFSKFLYFNWHTAENNYKPEGYEVSVLNLIRVFLYKFATLFSRFPSDISPLGKTHIN